MIIAIASAEIKEGQVAIWTAGGVISHDSCVFCFCPLPLNKLSVLEGAKIGLEVTEHGLIHRTGVRDENNVVNSNTADICHSHTTLNNQIIGRRRHWDLDGGLDPLLPLTSGPLP